MGFQRSVWDCVGRKRLEVKPAIYSRIVVLVVVFPYAEEWWFLVLFCFFFLFPFFLLPTKGLLWPRFKSPCPRRTFPRCSRSPDHGPLFMPDDFAALKCLLPFEVSAICLGLKR